MLAPTLITIEATRQELNAAYNRLERMNVDLPKACVAGALTKNEVHQNIQSQKALIKSLEKRLKDEKRSVSRK